MNLKFKGGGTDFKAAFEAAKGFVENQTASNEDPVVIFMSDGENGGPAFNNAAASIGRGKHSKRIEAYVVGVWNANHRELV